MYFDCFKTEHEVKDRFRLLAKRLHPDHGGDAKVMAEIIEAYDKFLSDLKKPKAKQNPYPFGHDFQAVYKSKINMIYEWAKDNNFFDLTFIDSISLRLNSGWSLTPKQKEAIDKIITKFKIKDSNE